MFEGCAILSTWPSTREPSETPRATLQHIGDRGPAGCHVILSGMFDLSRLTPEACVRWPGDAVTLVSVRQGPFWEFVFRGPSDGFGEVTLPEDELPGSSSSANGPLFDGDPRQFRLGVEA